MNNDNDNGSNKYGKMFEIFRKSGKCFVSMNRLFVRQNIISSNSESYSLKIFTQLALQPIEVLEFFNMLLQPNLFSVEGRF